MLDFVKKLTVKVPEPVEGPTSKPYIYFACTCGDNCGLTEKVFRKAVEAKGWNLSACFSVQMPETYIGMAGFKLDSEKNAQLKIDRADDLLMLQQICH